MAFLNVENLKDEEYINNHYIIMCTKRGIIKKTTLESYSRPRINGINAIGIREDDQLLEAKLTTGDSFIMLAAKSGKAIRFHEDATRPMGRNATGVRGIRIEDTDEVIGMICVNDVESNVLVVSENGYGKRSDIEDYRITNRGGKGVKTISITEKTGNLIAIKNVTDENDLMIIKKSGVAIRLEVEKMRVMGRATQGVRLITLKSNDFIAAVAKVNKDEEEEEELVDGESTEVSEDSDNTNTEENNLEA
jgi:DNA gyrase subunit A